MPAISIEAIDAHHHIWQPGAGRYPWMQAGNSKFMGDPAPVCTNYEIADFRAEAAGAGVSLAASVHLQCGRDIADPLVETAWVQQQADAAGHAIAIVGYGNPALPAFDALLDGHAAHAGFRGIRHMLNWGETDRYRLCDRGDYMQDAAWLAGLKRLAARGLSFDLQVNAWQLEEAAAMARALPELRIILNHAGMPFEYRDVGFHAWQRGMAALAASPNVAAKFSGLGMVDPAWDANSVRPLFDFMLEKFGPDRLMFASNFPIDRLYGSYGRVYDAYRRLAADLSPAEQRALFFDTAQAIYRPARKA
ncbi:amidohydrolase [Ferrovibrio sp.]|uniref:amidohydrolase family protein n=1 Tax=Ferrovibrio sp. TaxID=1917215 RepID=UPI0035AE8DE3